MIKKARSSLVGASLPKLYGVFSFLIFGLIGFVVYKLYKKLFSDSQSDKAQDKDEKISVKNYQSAESSESKTVDLLTSALSKQGLKVQVSHHSTADTLHRLLDSPNPNHANILSIIQGMSKQTYQLVFTAYGLRELINYRNTHLFDSDSWKDLFSDKKLYGSLKYHLGVVLESSELKKINAWLILT